MENMKNLEIQAGVCDVRTVTEETLSAYGQIEINAGIVVSCPAARAILNKYRVEVNAGHTIDAEGQIRIAAVNGPMQITLGQIPPEEKTILMINGPLDVAPGTGETLRNYAAIMVNGPIAVPESMTGLLIGTGLTVNGPVRAYPDGCIRLKPNAVLDRTFPLRAKQDALYYAAKRMTALAPDIDFIKLSEKNVRFMTPKLFIAESLTETALPLFDEKTDICVLPDGCAYFDDSTELDEAAVLRSGGKLYVDGDLTVLRDGPWLDNISFLQASGDILLARGLERRFNALKASCNNLRAVGGTLLKNRADFRLTRGILENAENGLSLASCVNVTVSEDVSLELLREKLVSVANCVHIICTDEQRDIIEPLASDTIHIGPEETENNDLTEEENPNIISINTSFYTL